MNNATGNVWTSWPIIIVAFIIFWPVGVFLLIKRLTENKTNPAGAGGAGQGVKKAIGIILIVIGALGGIGTLGSTTENSDWVGGFIVALMFIAGGIALLLNVKKHKKDEELVQKYRSIIVKGDVRRLDTIAQTIGRPYEVVHDEVKRIIEKGYIQNAYLDEGAREVVLMRSTAPLISPVKPKHTTANATSAKTKTVACPCCGANNTIVGNTGECEYCGAVLK